MHAVLEYTYEDNYLETRGKYRADHLKAGWKQLSGASCFSGSHW